MHLGGLTPNPKAVGHAVRELIPEVAVELAAAFVDRRDDDGAPEHVGGQVDRLHEAAVVRRHEMQRVEERLAARFFRVLSPGNRRRRNVRHAPRLMDSAGKPLAYLSVIGARLALPMFAYIALVLVDASLVGNGIGDADTGIVGVCLCWWNAEGCQGYGCCRRHAQYRPRHQFFLFVCRHLS